MENSAQAGFSENAVLTDSQIRTTVRNAIAEIDMAEFFAEEERAAERLIRHLKKLKLLAPDW